MPYFIFTVDFGLLLCYFEPVPAVPLCGLSRQEQVRATVGNSRRRGFYSFVLLDKSEFEGVICNIHPLGAWDFSPSYGLAPHVFVGLKSHAPIYFCCRFNSDLSG